MGSCPEGMIATREGGCEDNNIRWGNGDAHRRPKWGGGGGGSGDAHGLRRGGRTRPMPSRGRKFAAGRKIRPSIRNRTTPYGQMDPTGTGGTQASYSCIGSGLYTWGSNNVDPNGTYTGCSAWTQGAWWMTTTTAAGCDGSSDCGLATLVMGSNGMYWCHCGEHVPGTAPIGGW